MQNRTNRNLLFGPRANNGPSGSAAEPSAAALADAENVEHDNQQSIDVLRSSAGTIKDIALTVDASVSDHNRMLDRMDKRFEASNTLVASTMGALQELVSERPASRMCALISAIFLVLVVLYLALFR